ncbi:MAG: DUF1638 domain-containing protein [Phycisphaerales bacterium]|nr:DUF1638 domain-containing protein [Phycisphaerales bacterium]
MRLKLISCEIFYREMCAVVARSPNCVDIEFLPYGLHTAGTDRMKERLQQAIDQVEPDKYEAVLLGYGLCNNGICGLQAGADPLIVPRAHDCITLFLGSKERYLDYFNNHPGVYYQTTGWVERGTVNGELEQSSFAATSGMNMNYEEMVAKYGEDNARYLYEQFGDLLRNYTQYTFIEMGIEPDDSHELIAREKAQARNWTFEKIRGDITLIQRLVDGPWDEDVFLTVPPGHRLVACYDDSIIASEPVSP